MQHLHTKTANTVHTQTLAALRAMSPKPYGLARADAIFEMLIERDDCTYSKWSFDRLLWKRKNDDTFARAVFHAMLHNIDENTRAAE